MNIRRLFREKMSEQERASLRTLLKSYVADHPASENIPFPARHLFYNSILTSRPMMISLVLAAMLAAGGGTAFAAEQSLPGDTLYPVKIHVNENIRSALAVSSETQAGWDASMVERRLGEARELALQRRLSATSGDALAERFTSQEEKVQAAIDRLNQQGRTEVAAALQARLEAMIAAHQAVLTELSTDGSVSEETLKKLREAMNQAVQDHKRLRTAIKNRADSQEDADIEREGSMAKNGVENQIRSVEKFIEKRGDNLSEEAKTQAQTELETARTELEAGNTALEAGDKKEAFARYHAAIRAAHRARAVATLNLRAAVQTDDEREDEESDPTTEPEDNDDQDESSLKPGRRVKLNLSLPTE